MKFRKTLITLLSAVVVITTGAIASQADDVTTVPATPTPTQVTQVVTKPTVKKLSKSERAAKRWIAKHESGGNYRARNGNCYGKYQLAKSYLHGNYSHANQEKTADKYVHHRYGSWKKAKRFWQAHHWY